MIPNSILDDVYRQPDFSHRFLNYAEELCDTLQQDTGYIVDKVGCYNYSVSFMANLLFDSMYIPVSHFKAAEYLLKIFLSAKGRYYTCRCMIRVHNEFNGTTWCRLKSFENHRELIGIIDRIDDVLIPSGLHKVDGVVLDEKVPNYFTQIDKMSATLMQALFAEIT